MQNIFSKVEKLLKKDEKVFMGIGFRSSDVQHLQAIFIFQALARRCWAS
jgi:hypothetical protein